MSEGWRGRRSTYEFSKTAVAEPGDEAVAQWSPDQLERMDEKSRRALERAIARGEERADRRARSR
jgi:hypothetical protein